MANKSNVAPSAQRFEILPGDWQGHKLDGSRTNLPKGMLSYLANGRMVHGDIVPRPGLSRANADETADTITGRIVGLAELNDAVRGAASGGIILVNSNS
jgi:hypothetical protein